MLAIYKLVAASMYFLSVSFVYQLSGQCLIFLVDQIFFGTPNFFLVNQILFLVDQILLLVDQILFLVDQIFVWYTKKWEIDRTIGIPKRLTKSTWIPLVYRFFSEFFTYIKTCILNQWGRREPSLLPVLITELPTLVEQKSKQTLFGLLLPDHLP